MTQKEFSDKINQIFLDTIFYSNNNNIRIHFTFIELLNIKDDLLHLIIYELHNNPTWVIIELVMSMYIIEIPIEIRGKFKKLVKHILKILNIKLRETKLNRIMKDT